MTFHSRYFSYTTTPSLFRKSKNTPPPLKKNPQKSPRHIIRGKLFPKKSRSSPFPQIGESSILRRAKPHTRPVHARTAPAPSARRRKTSADEKKMEEKKIGKLRAYRSLDDTRGKSHSLSRSGSEIIRHARRERSRSTGRRGLGGECCGYSWGSDYARLRTSGCHGAGRISRRVVYTYE